MEKRNRERGVELNGREKEGKIKEKVSNIQQPSLATKHLLPPPPLTPSPPPFPHQVHMDGDTDGKVVGGPLIEPVEPEVEAIVPAVSRPVRPDYDFDDTFLFRPFRPFGNGYRGVRR